MLPGIPSNGAENESMAMADSVGVAFASRHDRDWLRGFVTT
jgi:hypothetical protein